jgi:hypothetical protein
VVAPLGCNDHSRVIALKIIKFGDHPVDATQGGMKTAQARLTAQRSRLAPARRKNDIRRQWLRYVVAA